MRAYYTIHGDKFHYDHGGLDARKLAEVGVEEWWFNTNQDKDYDEIEVTISDDEKVWGTFNVRVYMSPTFEATMKG